MINLPSKINPSFHAFSSTACTVNKKKETPGFSPMLAIMLSLTAKGGLCNKTIFSLFRDLYPYTSGKEKEQIEQILSCKTCANSLLRHPALRKNPHQFSRLLSSEERLFGMISVIKKYSAKHEEDALCMLERILKMNAKINRCQTNPSITDLFSLMGGNSASSLANMMQMMKQFNI